MLRPMHLIKSKWFYPTIVSIINYNTDLVLLHLNLSSDYFNAKKNNDYCYFRSLFSHPNLKYKSFLDLDLLALGLDLCRNAVQIPTALGRQLTSTVGRFLNQFTLLQTLERFTSDTSGRFAEMTGVRTVPFPSSEDFGNGTDSDGAANVNVADQSWASYEVPIWVVGREFLEAGSFDNVNPVWNGQFSWPAN